MEGRTGKGSKEDPRAVDQDWYLLEAPDGTHILRAVLSGVAGVDLSLEAFDGKRKRLVRVDNSKEGEGEVLVNLAVDAGTYFLLVKLQKSPRRQARPKKRQRRGATGSPAS